MALILDFFRRDKVLSGFYKFSLGQCYRAGIFLLGSFNVKLILQRVSSACVFVNENLDYGFKDTQGEIVIKPIYEYADNFSNGLALVRDSGRFGFI